MSAKSRKPLLIQGLVASAVLLVQLASVQRQSEWSSGAAHLVLGILGALGFWFVGASARRLVWGVVSAALVAFAGHGLAASGWLGLVEAKGSTLEVQLIDALRNMMLALVVVRGSDRTAALVGLISLFLVIFSLLSVFQATSIAVLFIYSLLGIGWLAIGSRERWHAPALVSDTRVRSTLWIRLISWVVLGGFFCALAGWQTRPVTAVLRGFLPSSGGDGGADQRAHGGVGDGDQLVSARDRASSFGPVRSELYLESKMPSLYDAFNDQYSEPTPPKKKLSQRAIPLAPNRTQVNHEKKATTQKAGREFSTLRQPTNDRPAPPDLRSHAMFYVSGRTPLHLKLDTFNTWNGTELDHTGPSPDDEKPLPLRLDQVAGLPWVVVRDDRQLPASWFGPVEQHGVRVINLRTQKLPAPSHLTSFHIDQIHTATLFARCTDGTIAFAGEFLPQLTMVELQSRFLRADRLQQLPLERVRDERGGAGGESAVVADGVRVLLSQWVKGTSAGWSEIDAVCKHLRDHCRLDSKQLVPADVSDSVEYFLLKSHAGPDYLFAITAATLLRELGYQTQVVSGFYARPENWDRQGGVTAVFRNDVHFWVEVALDDGTWIPVEPTPGYQLLMARQSWWDIATQLVTQGLAGWQNHGHEIIAYLLLGGLVYHRRCWLIDSAATWWWWRTYRRVGSREAVQKTLWLLELRAWLSQQARRPSETVAAWCQRELSQTPPEPSRAWSETRGETRVEERVRDFVQALQQALYGTSPDACDTSLGLWNSCRWAVSVYSTRKRKT